MRPALTVKLGEVAEFTNGGAWSQSEYSESGIPVVRVSDISNETVSLAEIRFLPESSLTRYEKHQLEAGDLVITTVGSHPNQPASMVGRPAIIPFAANGALLNQNAVRISPKTKDLDKQYLGIVGRSAQCRHYIIQHARGSANQVRMSIGLLKEMPIRLPPLETQQKIAAVLSAYDDLIENNSRRIKVLEEMAGLIYREWFANFRFPGHEGVRMVDSELGKIPESWSVKKLGDVLELAYGKALKADSRIFGAFSVYGSGGVVGQHNAAMVNAPGIIVGRKGNVGSVFWSDVDFWPIDTVFYVVSDIPLHFLYFNLQQQAFLNSDAAVPGLSRNQAYLNPVIVPSAETLKRFQKVIVPIFEHLRVLRLENQNLRRTRDLLLPKLISGELDVSQLGELPETGQAA